MKHYLFAIFTMLSIAFPNFVFAANAAPLGLELGVATYAQAKQQVGGKTSLSDIGTNKYSGGKMLQGDGAGLGIEGLSEITFIFDKSDKLAGVLMTMPKGSGFGDLENGNFKKTLAALSAKYKLDEKHTPFVGDASARLHQGDSVIEVTAPHLSFNMEVRYLSNELQKAFKQQSSSERATKEKRQADLF